MGQLKARLSRILYPSGVTVIDPKKATALFLILFSTQLTLTTPFSYLPEMVQGFGYLDKDRGYYAGMIASSLFAGRFFGGYFWGWLADKVGRRPVLLVSSCLTFLATIAFGFTTSFAWAMITRFIQGLVNGVIVCGRAAFAEICDDTNQAIGVSLVFAAWNTAIVLGPALGGFLAEPVKKYPHAFSGASSDFFTKFAYLLPSVLITSILFVAIIMIYFIFEEPKQERVCKEDQKKLLELNEITNEDAYHMLTEDVRIIDVKEKKMTLDAKIDMSDEKKIQKCCNEIRSWSLYELLSDKLVVLIVVMFGISGFCIIGFSELSSLWMATNTVYGGLRFGTDNIGISLLVPALVAVVFQPIIFGRFERKIGGIWTLKLSLVVLTLATVFFPYIHYAGSNKYLLWFLLVTFGVLRMIADISSRSCIALFINNAVYKDQAGRANGLAFSVQELMRVASPSFFGSLFAWSINDAKHEIKFPLDFRLSFMAISVALLVILTLSFLLPKSINGSKAISPISSPTTS